MLSRKETLDARVEEFEARLERMKQTERSPFVPRAGCETPVPNWKRSEWARDAIPEHDPARDPAKPAK